MIDLSLYLLIGLALSIILACWPNRASLILTISYWAAFFLNSLPESQLFSTTSHIWLELLNIKIQYRVDGLAKLFSMLISGIGILVFAYASSYTQDHPDYRAKLYATLQAFAVAMITIVLADDMILLYLGWEATTITSYLLIQFKQQDPASNQAAFNSIFITTIGSLAMLAGFVLLHTQINSWSISDVIMNMSAANSSHSKLDTAIFLLILCGAVTKSAQFPFYFWLTGAMRAPTPVSAYLHSATMVNAGIYLLARFHPAFSSLPSWYISLALFGQTTMLVSSFLSLFQQDLKAILAYTTIFALGAMIYLLASTKNLAIEALVIFLTFHAIYKAAAFMLVGIVDLEYGTRKLNQLHGIARQNIPLAVMTITIFSAMAGLPPFFGFTSKEMIFEAKLAGENISYILISLSTISSMLVAATSFRCIWRLLYRAENILKPQKKVKYGLLCPGALSLIIILISVCESSLQPVLQPAAQSLVSISDLEYVTTNTIASVILSLITGFGGIVLFLAYYFTKNKQYAWPKRYELKELFEQGFEKLINAATRMTHWLQNKQLQQQLMLSSIGILAPIFIIVITMLNLNSKSLQSISSSPEIIVFFITMTCAGLSLIVTHKFLNNLISISLIGLLTTFFFIVNGAIDVAITQLLVEVLSIVIILVVFIRTPKEQIQSHQVENSIPRLLISFAFGALAAFLLLLIRHIPIDSTIQDFYRDHSLSLGYGKNIVNVILVDFRSLDTLGEALVIVGTAISIYLLRERKCR